MRTKLNRKRLAGVFASWIVYAGLVWWLSYQEARVSLFGILLLSSLTTLLCIWLAWKPWKTTVLSVAAAIMLAPVPAGRAQSNKQDPFVTECLIGAVVIGVGIVLAIGLTRVCKRCLPPAQPPPQPPATNAPPNTVTNPPPKKAMLMNLSDDALSYNDVSSISLSNTDCYGNPYTVWISGGVQSSTNLSDWKTEFTMNAWVSVAEICTIVYDAGGSPVSTNWSLLSGQTNASALASLTSDDQVKFFRTFH